jgi:signal peptidase I
MVLLSPGFYYAMGDNSFNSFDSRYWGPVPERNLLGPASVVHWPFTSPRWGWIK